MLQYLLSSVGINDSTFDDCLPRAMLSFFTMDKWIFLLTVLRELQHARYCCKFGLASFLAGAGLTCYRAVRLPSDEGYCNYRLSDES